MYQNAENGIYFIKNVLEKDPQTPASVTLPHDRCFCCLWPLPLDLWLNNVCHSHGWIMKQRASGHKYVKGSPPKTSIKAAIKRTTTTHADVVHGCFMSPAMY